MTISSPRLGTLVTMSEADFQLAHTYDGYQRQLRDEVDAQRLEVGRLQDAYDEFQRNHSALLEHVQTQSDLVKRLTSELEAATKDYAVLKRILDPKSVIVGRHALESHAADLRQHAQDAEAAFVSDLKVSR